MPRAERGTPKAIANQQKSKGLQRLRWYCQVCEKQCRDENEFKCHVQSEAHVRQMLLVGENAHRHVANYSRQFMGDFLQLLRTTHGEKRVNANHFYASQYIANKNHVHMNATRWKTLTEFITFLGYSGICKVENTEKGWFISWIDNSPEALKKRDATLKRDRLEKGEADREERLIHEQIERAKQDTMEQSLTVHQEKVEVVKSEPMDVEADGIHFSRETEAVPLVKKEEGNEDKNLLTKPPAPIVIQKPLNLPTSISFSLQKPVNPLKSSNPLKSAIKKEAKKEDITTNEYGKRPLPKAVEIMQEELERKRLRDSRNTFSFNIRS